MYVSLNGALLAGGKVGWPDFARLAARVGYPGVDLNLGAAMAIKETTDTSSSLRDRWARPEQRPWPAKRL